MDETMSDTAGVIARPPVIYAATLLVGLMLHLIDPIPILPKLVRRLIGWPLIGAGGALAVWAVRTLRQAQTNVDPHQPTTAIVTDGPYRYTRNPIYVAFTALYAGIALLVNGLWVMLMLPVALMIMRRGVIEREERYLERKFPEVYLPYKTRVRRWL